MHTALGGQEIIHEVGPEAIEARNRHLTRRLESGLDDAGFQLRMAADPAHRTAIGTVRHVDPEGAVPGLAVRGIIVDHRPGLVRVSPRFYNTESEIDAFVEGLAGGDACGQTRSVAGGGLERLP